MVHLTKESHETELTEFNKKFYNKKKSYMITSDMNGHILSIETKDKEILAHVKKLGMK